MAMKKNYDLLIFTEGGGSLGLGHIMRCSALYEVACRQEKNPLFVINGNENVKRILENKNVMLDNWYKKIEDYIINCKKKPYVIVDSYIAELECYQKVSELSEQALFIDDNLRVDYPKGTILNPSLFGEELNYRVEKDQLLTGEKYIILRNAFSENSYNYTRKNKQVIRNVLILMGGTDTQNLTPELIDILEQNFDAVPNIDIVLGLSAANKDEVQKKVFGKDYIKLHFNLKAKDLCELMKKSDMAITTAGQTVYELIAMQLPFICIQVVENQRRNAMEMKRRGLCGEAIDYEKNKNVWKKDMQLELMKLKEYHIRNSISEKMRSLNIVNGAERIMTEFLRT